jgi:transcriptional regulator GlxA family with amidase domain
MRAFVSPAWISFEWSPARQLAARPNKFRIEEAQRMMRHDPKRGVTDVMFSSGFQNKSTFNAAFRAITGESPSIWPDRLDDAAS